MIIKLGLFFQKLPFIGCRLNTSSLKETFFGGLNTTVQKAIQRMVVKTCGINKKHVF